MARASAKRGRRPRANARTADQPVAKAQSSPVADPAAEPAPEPAPPKTKAEPKPRDEARAKDEPRAESRRFGRQPKPKAPPRPEDTMFFTRLRTHAKWVFVLLALVFAIGFVAFGVGAGGTGIGDAIQGLFGGDDVPTLEEAKARVEENPNDTEALLELANIAQGAEEYELEADTLDRYLALEPNDASALHQLATAYELRATQVVNEALGTGASAARFPQLAYLIPGTSGFIGAIGESQIYDALTNRQEAARLDAQGVARDAYANAADAYERITKLEPDDAETFLALGEAARLANDLETAIPAYERFLELAPDHPLAPGVEETLAALQADEESRIENG